MRKGLLAFLVAFLIAAPVATASPSASGWAGNDQWLLLDAFSYVESVTGNPLHLTAHVVVRAFAGADASDPGSPATQTAAAYVRTYDPETDTLSQYIFDWQAVPAGSYTADPLGAHARLAVDLSDRDGIVRRLTLEMSGPTYIDTQYPPLNDLGLRAWWDTTGVEVSYHGDVFVVRTGYSITGELAGMAVSSYPGCTSCNWAGAWTAQGLSATPAVGAQL